MVGLRRLLRIIQLQIPCRVISSHITDPELTIHQPLEEGGKGSPHLLWLREAQEYQGPHYIIEKRCQLLSL